MIPAWIGGWRRACCMEKKGTDSQENQGGIRKVADFLAGFESQSWLDGLGSARLR
jgi:hypothetical protein